MIFASFWLDFPTDINMDTDAGHSDMGIGIQRKF